MEYDALFLLTVAHELYWCRIFMDHMVAYQELRLSADPPVQGRGYSGHFLPA